MTHSRFVSRPLVLAASVLTLGLWPDTGVGQNPPPAELTRDAFLSLVEERFEGLPRSFQEFERFGDVVLADGTVVGNSWIQARRDGDAIQVETGEISPNERSFSARYRFESRFPHLLVSVEYSPLHEKATQAPTSGYFAKVHRDTLRIYPLNEKRTGLFGVPVGLPTGKYRVVMFDRPFTLIDLLGRDLWVSMNPSVGARLALHELDLANTAIRVREHLLASGEALGFHPDRERVATVVSARNGSRTTLFAYDSDHREIFARRSHGIEIRTNSDRESGPAHEPTIRRAAYLLAHEIDDAPPWLGAAKAATLRICSASECGSGVLISNQGHVLTAMHVLEGNVLSFHIPELFGVARIQSVQPVGDGSVDAAIIKLAPIRGSVVDRDGRFHCVPLAPRSVGPGDGTWSIGFPSPSPEEGGDHFSDGVHEFIARGKVIHGQAPLQEILFTTDSVIRHGFSGGPVLGADGQLLGISLGTRMAALTAAMARTKDVSGEGTHQQVLSAESIYSLLAQEKGEAEAARAFDCRPRTAETETRFVARVPFGESPKLGPLESAAAALEGSASRWTRELFDLLARNDSLALSRAKWRALKEKAETGFPRFSAIGALKTRASTRALVLAEDLYPGVTPKTVVTAWAREAWADAVLGHCRELLDQDVIDLTPQETKRLLEAVDQFMPF